jgi:drug/metabolite transporter (DMT)-like permease
LLDCLIAAALWAISLSLYRRPIHESGPLAANLFKCAAAAIGYWAFILVVGAGIGRGGARDYLSLVVSGIVGFTLGDFLLFVSVREGGVQRALVLFNTSPLIATLLAIPMLGERPGSSMWVGMGLVLAGVWLVETDPVRIAAARERPPRRHPWLATLAGLGAAGGQALGILFSRGPLQIVPVLPATAIRLTAGAVTLAPLLAMVEGRSGYGGLAPRRWPRLLLPVLLGTVIALLFSMRGIRDVPAGVSSSLLATTPLFSLPIARFVLKERIGGRSVLGTLVAVGGIFLLSRW